MVLEYLINNLANKKLHDDFGVNLLFYEQNIFNDSYIGPYGAQHAKDVKKFLKDYVKVKDKEVLVIGSWRPWIEIMALMLDAKKVTSIDYQKIHCERPKLKMMTTFEFNEKFLNGELPKYDVVVSISSIEHAGLGRYE